MLTRLRVSGFKNLVDVDVEFGPYTCIAGPNGAGKSNLFDAIQFLALLADQPFDKAIQRVRGGDARSGEPAALFSSDAGAGDLRMSFDVEMVVPHRVADDFGRPAEASITFLRYRLELGYRPSDWGGGKLVLREEQLTHINRGQARAHLRFPHSAKEFRSRVVLGERRGGEFISTSGPAGERVVQVHQDGTAGRPKPWPATDAVGTIVHTATQSSSPTILAARREFQSWRRLALEPSAMYKPDEFTAPQTMGTNGAHLAATLYRMAHEPSVRDPEDVYAAVASRLSALVPVHSLRVERDDNRALFTIFVKESRHASPLPAQALSDGTLRFLAMCILSEDDRYSGLLCMEEPENGIHPRKIESMSSLIRDLAVDPSEAPGPGNPMRQVIVNTHSPTFVRSQSDADVLLAKSIATRREDRGVARSLALVPLRSTWRTKEGVAGCGRIDLEDYLAPMPNETLTFDFAAS